MHIDSYEFGQIVIDGQTYSSDCIILAGSVNCDWWREQGHSLSAKDIEIILEAKPKILVIGKGASGLMNVPERTKQVLKQKGIEFEALDTKEAVKRFNELSKVGENVAAALHLTC